MKKISEKQYDVCGFLIGTVNNYFHNSDSFANTKCIPLNILSKICQSEIQCIPWSLKSQVSFVLDLDPMKTGVTFAVRAEVVNEI